MPNSNKPVIVIGILMAGIGLVPILMAIGVLAPPQPSADDTPTWIIGLVGAVFLLGGTAIVISGAVGGSRDSSGELPDSAPRALRALYDLAVIGVAVTLAVVASWIGFGPGERQFSMSAGGGGAAVAMGTSASSQLIGRVAFGFGAIVMWLIAGAVAMFIGKRWFAQR